MRIAALLLLILSGVTHAAGIATSYGESKWAYFKACGFEQTKNEVAVIRGPAPNIAGYWIKLRTIAAVVDWRHKREGSGPPCASIYVRGADHAVHVIGTTEEILNKLRN